MIYSKSQLSSFEKAESLCIEAPHYSIARPADVEINFRIYVG